MRRKRAFSVVNIQLIRARSALRLFAVVALKLTGLGRDRAAGILLDCARTPALRQCNQR